MQKLIHAFKHNTLNTARWLMILEAIALLFSPPLTLLFEFTLYVTFFRSQALRTRLFAACKQPIVIAGLLFYLAVLIASAYSIDSWKISMGAFWAWRKILLLPIAVALFDDDFWKKKLAITFVTIVSVCAVLSFLGYFTDLAIYKYPVGIILRNHATQGIMFAVAAFTSSILLLSQEKSLSKNQRWLMLLSILLLVGNVIYVTPGRSGYLAFIVLAITLVFSYAYTNKKLLFPLIALALIPVLLFSSPTVRQRVTQGVGEAQQVDTNNQDTSMGIRMVLWKNTLELIKEHPILGYGTGSFKSAYTPKVLNGPKWQLDITHDPHNQFLKIWVEQGGWGLLVFLSIIFSAFWQKPSPTYRVLGIGIMLVWCGNSLFSSHFSTFSEGRFVFLWCGVMLANSSNRKS